MKATSWESRFQTLSGSDRFLSPCQRCGFAASQPFADFRCLRLDQRRDRSQRFNRRSTLWAGDADGCRDFPECVDYRRRNALGAVLHLLQIETMTHAPYFSKLCLKCSHAGQRLWGDRIKAARIVNSVTAGFVKISQYDFPAGRRMIGRARTGVGGHAHAMGSLQALDDKRVEQIGNGEIDGLPGRQPELSQTGLSRFDDAHAALYGLAQLDIAQAELKA